MRYSFTTAILMTTIFLSHTSLAFPWKRLVMVTEHVTEITTDCSDIILAIATAEAGGNAAMPVVVTIATTETVQVQLASAVNAPALATTTTALVPAPTPVVTSSAIQTTEAPSPPTAVTAAATAVVTLVTTIIVTPFLDANGNVIPGGAVSTPAPATAPSPSSPPAAVVPAASSSAPQAVGTTVPVAANSFLRGVSLGGWLVLEKWMNDDAFTGAFSNAVDEWTFSQVPGAASALQTHWDTFFTEADFQAIAATGINALRIPIGFWAYDNAGTPYLQGADAYLEKAIGWARSAGLKVWIDSHGSPGSQNGFDNSGHAGSVDWQQAANLARSISVLKTMATKYGALQYADVVVGIELVNEPISWGSNDFGVTKTWVEQAFAAVKAEVVNPNLLIITHDSFQGPLSWTSVAQNVNSKQFAVDTHLYQVFVDADNKLNQAQHIQEACGWASDLGQANKIFPTFVGEWTALTNICVNPDGSTTAGTSCSVDGCQCSSAGISDWNPLMVEQVRRYVEAQLDVYESNTSGYFMWSAKGPGGWGFLNGIQAGIIPNPVTSRKYGGQCS